LFELVKKVWRSWAIWSEQNLDIKIFTIYSLLNHYSLFNQVEHFGFHRSLQPYVVDKHWTKNMNKQYHEKELIYILKSIIKGELNTKYIKIYRKVRIYQIIIKEVYKHN